MQDTINQENLRLLIPGKAARIASMLAKARKITPEAALLAFYRSPLYRQLEREETKLWHFSPEQLYAIGFSRPPAARTQIRRGPGKSILLPHKDMILDAWNTRRLSARAIAEKLAALGIHTTPQNVWKFIQNHSGGRRNP